jgi:RES domain-containing protein
MAPDASQRPRFSESVRYAHTRSIGDTWLAEERTAVLRVPSAVVPAEMNYVINPRHRAAKAIHVVGRRKFAFDSRLLS